MSGVDAGQEQDGATGDGGASSGLKIEIEADPSRGAFEADFDPTLDDIEIVLRDFRAIGDAAPGDERTRVPSLTLTFSENDSRTVRFAEAPIGQYSRVRARVDRFVTRGTLTIDQTALQWEIDVQPAGGIELDIAIANVELAAGEEADIEIEARLDRPYDEINWDALTPENGVLRVDETSPEFDEIRSKIIETFSQED